VLRSWVATILLVLLLAGCFGSDPAPDPEPMAPAPSPAPGPNYPADAQLAQTGRWEPVFDGEVPAVNMALLHNGRVLYWSGIEANREDGDLDWTLITTAPLAAQSRVLDLSSGQPNILVPESPEGAGGDLFCTGMTILPDGRVMALGASEWHTQPNIEPFVRGAADARLYDPETNTWERKADMLFDRWYASAITLPDGRALVASGIGSITDINEHWPQLETYDAATDSWTYLEGADKLLPLYARLMVVPGGPLKGDLFYNTVGTLWAPFGEHPRQHEWASQAGLDFAAPAWNDHGRSTFGARTNAATVAQVLDAADDYAPRFVTFGGTLMQEPIATPFTERIDLSTNPPTNTMGANMNQPRWHLNGVLLPDDTILAVGGGLYDNVFFYGAPNVPVLSAELYDPAGDTWTELADMTVPRIYHSTALLLPDGRVLVGGHVPDPNPFPVVRDTANPQIVERRLEIFEPPYLFRGPRPVIEEAPRHATYGDVVQVRVDNASKVRDLVLMKPGSTTHALDSNQRGIRLDFAAQADGVLDVTLPPDAVVAPPGYYMLFVLGEGNGGLVPSVATFLHLV
jgi:hypothetical protein